MTSVAPTIAAIYQCSSQLRDEETEYVYNCDITAVHVVDLASCRTNTFLNLNYISIYLDLQWK